MTPQQLHALLGTRWALLVLTALAAAPHRFSKLKRSLVGVSQRMLSETVHALAAAGLVDRTASVGAVTYALTAYGREVFAWAVRPMPCRVVAESGEGASS